MPAPCHRGAAIGAKFRGVGAALCASAVKRRRGKSAVRGLPDCLSADSQKRSPAPCRGSTVLFAIIRRSTEVEDRGAVPKEKRRVKASRSQDTGVRDPIESRGCRTTSARQSVKNCESGKRDPGWLFAVVASTTSTRLFAGFGLYPRLVRPTRDFAGYQPYLLGERGPVESLSRSLRLTVWRDVNQ